jgi:hypothetical protein
LSESVDSFVDEDFAYRGAEETVPVFVSMYFFEDFEKSVVWEREEGSWKMRGRRSWCN